MNDSVRPLINGDSSHLADSVSRELPWFGRLSRAIHHLTGAPQSTGLILLLVFAWLCVGLIVGFSHAWEVTATAGAPIAALLLLVVMQHTQNRDTAAVHLKLNEIIRSSTASDGLISIEDSPQVELRRLLSDYRTQAGQDQATPWETTWAAGGGRPGRRQRHRFAKGDLGPERSFIFRSSEGGLNVAAQNLQLFTSLAAGVSDDIWLTHLRRGDYTRWFGEVIGDDDLARMTSSLESGEGHTAEESRRVIVTTIARRFPLGV